MQVVLHIYIYIYTFIGNFTARILLKIAKHYTTIIADWLHIMEIIIWGLEVITHMRNRQAKRNEGNMTCLDFAKIRDRHKYI